MQLNFNLNDYDQIIEIKEGQIIKFHCLCPDFYYRHIHKNPMTMCKHIKQAIQLNKENQTFCDKHMQIKDWDNIENLYVCQRCFEDDGVLK